MSEGLNRVILLGNLGADPDMRRTKAGLAVMSLRIAVTERRKVREQWEDVTEWVNVTVWGGRAEGLAKVLRKGSALLVEGRLHSSSYEKDGMKRYKTEVIADRVVLAGSGSGQRRESDAAPEAPIAGDDFGTDDIPF